MSPTSAMSKKAFLMLQAAAGLCFIGHGVWGLVQKTSWLVFYRPFGIPDELALMSMPIIGAIDILVGLSVLIRPTKAALGYMVFWATFTALLRPMAGLGWWEVLERGGNYGPPLALLLIGLVAYPGFKHLFKGLKAVELTPATMNRVIWVLRVSIALLLVGHGGFGLFQGKPMLLEHLAAVGIGDGTEASLNILRVQGGVEIALGIAVLTFPVTARTRVPYGGLVLGVLLWKLATELLYPIANPGLDVLEFVERAGDYFAPLALVFLLQRRFADLWDTDQDALTMAQVESRGISDEGSEPVSDTQDPADQPRGQPPF